MRSTRKMMIVDDDPDMIEQIRSMLSSIDCELNTFYSEKDAKAALGSYRPDIAIIDLMMEHGDSGFALCFDIKKRYPDVPVIILTSAISSTGISFSAGTDPQKSWVRADALICKPVRREGLLKEIEKLLNMEL